MGSPVPPSLSLACWKTSWQLQGGVGKRWEVSEGCVFVDLLSQDLFKVRAGLTHACLYLDIFVKIYLVL